MGDEPMAGNDAVDTRISTSDVQPAPVPAPPAAPQPPPAAPPVDQAPAAAPEALYAPGGPQPSGTEQASTTNERAEGFGVEGETVVWEGRYSLRNFLGRMIWLAVFAVAWIVLATWTWGTTHAAENSGRSFVAISAGVGVLIFALVLLRRVILARYGHFYRLTNRRLFVSTGLFNRRRDQMELLRVKDVYTRQSFTQRMLSLGSVVVVSTEPHFPMLYLTGVDDPKAVMDLVWHHARAERDGKSTKVDPI